MPVGEDIWEVQSGFSSYSSTNNEESEEPSMVIRTSNEPRALPETLAGGDTSEHQSAFSSFSSSEGEGIEDPDISSNKTEIPSMLPVGKETHGLTLKSSSNRVSFSNIAREILRTGCLWEQQPLYKPMMIFRKPRRFVGKIKALGVEHSVEGQIQIFASRLRLLLDGRSSEK
jgi:hypothetical protein